MFREGREFRAKDAKVMRLPHFFAFLAFFAREGFLPFYGHATRRVLQKTPLLLGKPDMR
jgi:hypothetical protein